MPDIASGTRKHPRRERKENANRRRAQLLDAALRSIVKNGLAGTTLATVSQEARLSQGVAVFYFNTKEALLGATFERHYERYVEEWRRALDEAPEDPAEKLAAIMRTDFDPDVCSYDSQIVWYAFWGETSAKPLYKEIVQRFDDLKHCALADVISSLLNEIGRDDGDARKLASGVEALTDGLWLQLYLSSGIARPEDALTTTGRFLAALFPEKADVFEKLG